MQQSNCNILLCNYHALVSDVLFFKEIHFNSIKRCTELTKVVFQQSLVDCKQVGITAGSELVMPEQCQWPLIRILYENFCCCCWCPYLQQSCENFCIHLDRWMILVKKENVKKTHTSKIKRIIIYFDNKHYKLSSIKLRYCISWQIDIIFQKL